MLVRERNSFEEKLKIHFKWLLHFLSSWPSSSKDKSIKAFRCFAQRLELRIADKEQGVQRRFRIRQFAGMLCSLLYLFHSDFILKH